MTPQETFSEAAMVVCLGADSKSLRLPEDKEKHLRTEEARRVLLPLLPNVTRLEIENVAHRAAETKAREQGGSVDEWFGAFMDLLLHQREKLCHNVHN